MSIENNLASIAKSLETIAALLASKQSVNPTPVAAPIATAHVPAPEAPIVAHIAPAPVVTGMPAAPFAPAPLVIPTVPVQSAAPVMPAAPVFVPPPAQAAAPVVSVPFNDAKTLQNYVVSAYTAMGPEKGQGIQQVIVSLGHQNINELRLDQYATFYQAVEAMRAS